MMILSCSFFLLDAPLMADLVEGWVRGKVDRAKQTYFWEGNPHKCCHMLPIKVSSRFPTARFIWQNVIHGSGFQKKKKCQKTDGYFSVLLGNCRLCVDRPQEREKNMASKNIKKNLVLCFEVNCHYF